MEPAFTFEIRCVAGWLGTKIPESTSLPSSIKRRGSPLVKASFAVAELCASKASVSPRTIFASRHGEATVLLRLLESLAIEEPLSPMDFSLSVHNANSGLFSIASNNREPSTSLAGGPWTVSSGFIETASSIASSRDDVPYMLVLSDMGVPKPFVPDVSTELNTAFALAFLCSKPTGDSQNLVTMTFSDSESEASGEIARLVHWIRSNDTSVDLSAAVGSWRLDKAAGPVDLTRLYIPIGSDATGG